MATLNVQFADATNAEIVSFFGSPQDEGAIQFLGTVDSSDSKWKAFFDRQPANAQQFLPDPTT